MFTRCLTAVNRGPSCPDRFGYTTELTLATPASWDVFGTANVSCFLCIWEGPLGTAHCAFCPGPPSRRRSWIERLETPGSLVLWVDSIMSRRSHMGVRRVQTSDHGPRLDSVTISSPGIPFLVLVCGGPPGSGPERVYRMSLGIVSPHRDAKWTNPYYRAVKDRPRTQGTRTW